MVVNAKFSGSFYFKAGGSGGEGRGGMMAIALEAKSFGRSLRYIMATAVAVAVALAQYIFNYVTKIDVSI